MVICHESYHESHDVRFNSLVVFDTDYLRDHAAAEIGREDIDTGKDGPFGSANRPWA